MEPITRTDIAVRRARARAAHLSMHGAAAFVGGPAAAAAPSVVATAAAAATTTTGIAGRACSWRVAQDPCRRRRPQERRRDAPLLPLPRALPATTTTTTPTTTAAGTTTTRARPTMIRGFPNKMPGPSDDVPVVQPEKPPKRPFDALVDFPCVFTFKVVGLREGEFVDDISNAVARVLKTERQHLKTSFRDRGKYRSITLSAPVNSSEQIYDVYAVIDLDKRVKFKF